MKTNFRIEKKEKSDEGVTSKSESITKELTRKEFEEYLVKSGATGSFMVYRSEKKDDELGIDQL
jgi:hypothetical protein|tara:strand:- start:6710 stop:6901 length:192 start_codon:yes stop_codon:yes gene_type:complete